MEITIPFPVINIKTNKTENSFLRIKYACEQPKENEKSVRYILERVHIKRASKIIANMMTERKMESSLS